MVPGVHRIRLRAPFRWSASFEKMLSGEVEADETFLGGKARNMHVGKRRRSALLVLAAKDKTPIMGILERGGQVRTKVVPNRRKKDAPVGSQEAC